MPSTVVAKKFDLRSNDFSSSSSVISLRSYDNCTSYDLILPSKDPRFINGVDGTEQIADQVFTYDSIAKEFIWKQAAASELFLQGQTTSIGNDENGNVMTIHEESRVVPGDPLYDPAKSDAEQVFKASYKFTDDLLNMSSLTCGKTHTGKITTTMVFDSTPDTVALDTYVQALVTATGYVVSHVLDNLTATLQITDSSKTVTVTSLTTAIDALDSTSLPSFTHSSVLSGDILHKAAGLYFDYSSANPGGTVDAQKQAKDKVIIQTKQTLNTSDKPFVEVSPTSTSLNYTDTVGSSKVEITKGKAKLVSHGTSESSLTQRPFDLTCTFADQSKFEVDNSTKALYTDMSCIAFGEDTSKHRFKVFDSKLYIQKWTGTAWVGADVVIDNITQLTQSLSMVATVSGQDIAVSLTPSGTYGTDWDHIGISIDGGTVEMLASNVTQKNFTSTTVGDHKIVAFLMDSSHQKLSEDKMILVTV